MVILLRYEKQALIKGRNVCGWRIMEFRNCVRIVGMDSNNLRETRVYQKGVTVDKNH